MNGIVEFTDQPELTAQHAKVVSSEATESGGGTSSASTTTVTSVPTDRSWFGSLFASDDFRADSIILIGIVATIAGIMFQAFAMCFPWMSVAWNPINYGGMVTAILGGLGVGKGVRNYLSESRPPPLPGSGFTPGFVDSRIPER